MSLWPKQSQASLFTFEDTGIQIQIQKYFSIVVYGGNYVTPAKAHNQDLSMTNEVTVTLALLDQMFGA